jgi:hypothetical protein
MTNPVPARLHVLIARESRTAVVLRRGPSNLVCTVGWGLRDDSFQLGQWLKGRIYERRSDLSPDGRHMIYFAKRKGATTKAWTAVSRAPFLKAIVLWLKGDSWNGGGLFTSNGSYWFNDSTEHIPHQFEFDNSHLQMDPYFPGAKRFGNECWGVYCPRLQRDGWILKGIENPGRYHTIARFEKALSNRWMLRKLVQAKVPLGAKDDHIGKGVYFDEHQLVDMSRGTVFDFPEWEWAEADGDRMLWAQWGRLYAAPISDRGLGEARELHDFNAMTFEAAIAPY